MGKIAHGKFDFNTKQLREDLACEKLTHIASILDYRYGVDATPAIDTNHDEYAIFVADENDSFQMLYAYDIDDMIKRNVEGEANRLWQFYMNKLVQ